MGISGDAARLVQKEVNLNYSVQRTSGNFGHVLDKHIMIPIRKIEKRNYSGKVYNLAVPSKESYTTFTGVVHNCISKHLLASSMRLMEVGTKELKKGNKNEAKNLFDKAYNLWNMFWGLNLNLIKVKDLPAEEREDLGIKKLTVWDKLGTVVKSIVNCCKE